MARPNNLSPFANGVLVRATSRACAPRHNLQQPLAPWARRRAALPLGLDRLEVYWVQTAMSILIVLCGEYPTISKSEKEKPSMSLMSGLMLSVGNWRGSRASCYFNGSMWLR